MALSYIRKKTDPLITIIIIAALALVIFLGFKYIGMLNGKIESYQTQIENYIEESEAWKSVEKSNLELKNEIALVKEEIEAIKAANIELQARNDELEPIFEAQRAEIEDLKKMVEEMDRLQNMNDELLQRWMKQAEKRPQPKETFKITFYSTEKTYEHLIDGKTVAMNSQQVADLGLRKGDEIYIKSNKGWSGFYTITDSGCAYGTIDIYVKRDRIPSYGVEYDVTILI